MKTLSKMRSYIVISMTCFLVSMLIDSSVLFAQSFKIFAVSDLVQVFEDGYNIPPSSDTIKLFGIRGEVLSGQCVIYSKSNLTSVTVETSILKNESGSSLPVKNMEWNFVGSIPLTKNAPDQPKQALVRQAPARFPDYLMAERQLNVNKGAYESVWITISIPENAGAGKYSGKVTVKSTQGDQSIPLMLTVYPLTLPAERNLKIIIWDNRSKFEQYHGIKEKYSDAWFDMLRKYADNMVSHRQNTFQVAMATIGCRKLNEGSYEFDFSLFDKVAQIYWSTGKMGLMELGLSDNRSELTNRGEKRFSSTEIFLNDIQLRNPETGGIIAIPGREILPFLMPALESHLRQKGWLHKSVLHICDEPAIHNALSWIEISEYIHSLAPDLRRLDAICTSYIINNLEVAVPKLDQMDAGYEIYRKWQEKGNELWFYTVGIHMGSGYPNKTIDVPLIGSRILHWLNFKYDAVGYLHWGWNQWSGDPFKDPGTHIGDAWHVYPVKDGVLNSIRWEQVRNGIQDYECFRMLEQQVKSLRDSLGSKFAWIEPSQRPKEIATQVATSLIRHSTDPIVLYKAREELLKEMVEFNTTPNLYVQTSPPEHGTVINRSVVELLGWAEPGSEIIINKQNIPVAKNGLFVLRSILFVGGKLQITVRKDGKEKTIIREFDVTF